MKGLTIIGDADGLMGFINPLDAHNQQAKRILSFLEAHNATLSFPTTTIAEAITTLIRKDASPLLAGQIIDHCRAGNILLTPVDETVMTTAITFFNPAGSKKNTIFDAIVAAVAKLYQADAIFSFDEWYSKQGFKITNDLVEEKEVQS
jgi:predicted nucleic acid-binding protein